MAIDHVDKQLWQMEDVGYMEESILAPDRREKANKNGEHQTWLLHS